MPSTYAPLAAYLAAQPPTTLTVTLTLAEIEQVLGVMLPPVARTRGWWKATGRWGQPRPWHAVGWEVSQVEFRTVPPRITFTRVPQKADGPDQLGATGITLDRSEASTGHEDKTMPRAARCAQGIGEEEGSRKRCDRSVSAALAGSTDHWDRLYQAVRLIAHPATWARLYIE